MFALNSQTLSKCFPVKKKNGMQCLVCLITASKSGFMALGFRIQEEGCQSFSYYQEINSACRVGAGSKF